MNQRYFTLLFCFATLCMALPGWSQVTGGPQVEVELTLKDDLGKPVKEADTTISYIGVVPNTGKGFKLTSDANGIVKAKSALNGLIKVKVLEEGYYPVVWPQLVTKGTWDGEKLLQQKITLREVKKPIPLHAKKVELVVPAFGQWIGFDLRQGDWIKPWGQGLVGDVEFFLKRTFNGYPENIAERLNHLTKLHESNPRLKDGYLKNVAEFYNQDLTQITFEDAKQHKMGNWTGELKIRVPTDGGGVYIEKESYQVFGEAIDYSRMRNMEMRLPHLAPEGAYQAEPFVWKKSYPTASQPDVDPKVGYFLRTRVKLDDEGGIVSANYAKIMTSDAKYHGSDIHFDPRGKISFTYYFNPTVNDRNLEFDPKKNLFPDLKDKEKVRLP